MVLRRFLEGIRTLKVQGAQAAEFKYIFPRITRLPAPVKHAHYGPIKPL